MSVFNLASKTSVPHLFIMGKDAHFIVHFLISVAAVTLCVCVLISVATDTVSAFTYNICIIVS